MSENVHLKRKVTLKEKQGDTSSTPTPKKWHRILIPVVAVAIAAGAAIVFWPKPDKGNKEQILQNEFATTQNTENGNSTDNAAVAGTLGENDNQTAKQTSTEEAVNKEVPEAQNVDRTALEKPDAIQPTSEKQSKPTVNKPLPANNTTPVAGHTFGQLTGDVEQDAKAVIRGEFGNGADRKAALGNRYQEIQDRVNAIYQEKSNN